MKDLEKFLKAAGFVGNKVEIDERSELFVLSDVSREDFDCVVGLLSKDAKKTAENGIGENAFSFALSGDDFIGVQKLLFQRSGVPIPEPLASLEGKTRRFTGSIGSSPEEMWAEVEKFVR